MRKYYIDNLRWGAILLLIPYHAAQAWNTWGEPNYIFFEGNRAISSIIVFFSPYFMPLLFVLAGMSTRYALQKRTIGQYVSDRAKKLLIPFVFGTLFFMPLMTYLADRHNCGYDGGLFSHYRIFFTKFTDLTGGDGGFSVGHFWFLLYLFVISVISAGIIVWQKKRLGEPRPDVPLWGLCLLGLPLPILSELLSVGGKSLAEYLYIFLIGYYVLSNDKLTEKIEKYKWFFLDVGLPAAVLDVYLFLWSEISLPVFNTIVKFIAEWFLLIALLGIGKAYFDRSGTVSKYMSSRSFLFYILHFIWVVLFQYLLYEPLLESTILLYLVPVMLAYAATFLCCELCVRIRALCFRI